MGTDLCGKIFAQPGDCVVCEAPSPITLDQKVVFTAPCPPVQAPTYYLCHQMFRERGLELLEASH
jgi:hypothetical protein